MTINKMKKGVSPVIATVILLTITVLLGAIIFKFSMDTVTSLSPPANCDDVAFEAGLYLDENNKLSFEINNIGSENIAGIRLITSFEEEGSIKTEEVAMAVLSGQSARKELDFLIGSVSEITAQAEIIQNGRLAICIKGEIVEFTQEYKAATN